MRVQDACGCLRLRRLHLQKGVVVLGWSDFQAEEACSAGCIEVFLQRRGDVMADDGGQALLEGLVV